MGKKREEILKRTKINTMLKSRPDEENILVFNQLIEILDSKSFHLYCYLLSCCDEDSFCYPSYDDIHAILGFNRTTISSCIKFLSEIGLIEILKRKQGSYQNNAYIVYSIQSIEVEE